MGGGLAQSRRIGGERHRRDRDERGCGDMRVGVGTNTCEPYAGKGGVGTGGGGERKQIER